MGELKHEIEVRPVHPEDAVDLYDIVRHPQVARSIWQLPSIEFPETLAWMEGGGPGQYRLVADMAGRVVGSASLTRPQRPRLDHSASLGLMVHPEHWNQGVGSKLVQALIKLADDWLNLKRIELDVMCTHRVAIHLYDKFGFSIEGTRRMSIYGDGRWQDEHVMARVHDAREQVNQSELDQPLLPVDRDHQKAAVIIRPMHPDDTAALHQLWRHPLVDRTTLQMPSMEYAAALERTKRKPAGLHRLVAEVDDKVVGAITLYQSQNPRKMHSAGLGMMVAPEYWGRGIGSQLLQAGLALADEWLNLKRLELDVNVDNPAAFRLYEHSGFVIEGTKRLHAYGDGRWADSHFMARLRT